MSWWLWVLLGFVLLAIEFASTTLHIAFFGGGALFVGLLVGLGWEGPLWAQLLVFTGFSLIALLFIRPPLMRKLKLNEPRVVDSLVGEHAIALDDIAVQNVGKARCAGVRGRHRTLGRVHSSKGSAARSSRSKD